MGIKMEYEDACITDISLDLMDYNDKLVPIYFIYLDDGKGGCMVNEYGKEITIFPEIDWETVEETYNEYFRSLYKVKGMKMARKDSGLVMLSTYKQWVLEYEKERK